MPQPKILKPPFTYFELIVPASAARKIMHVKAPSEDPRWLTPSDLLQTKKKRRGPRPGSIARFARDDRALFDRIGSMTGKGMSLSGAIRSLESERKIKGYGTSESRIKRVFRLYQKERLGLGR